MHTWKSCLTLAVLLCASQSLVSAQMTIPVTNASFELPHDNPTFTQNSAFGNYTNNVIDDWTGTGTFGVFVANTTPYPGGVPDGTQIAYVNSGIIYQNVAATLIAGTTYTLSSYVGNRADTPGSGSLSLQTTGGTLLASSGTITPTAGTFQRVSIVFTPLITDPNLGQQLRIVLSYNSGNQANFDRVGLTALGAVVPEPGSLTLLVGMTLTGAAFLRRRKPARKVA